MARPLPQLQCPCAQVGNLTLDHAFYGPPEALNEVLMPRPAYVAETASGASDLAGSMAGALAASAMVVKQYGSAEDAPKVTKYLAAAQQLYEAVCLAMQHAGMAFLLCK